ncbi:MAG: S41 family peptidase [Bacteroidales bacterium]|nr:S41 family peptidase [Bacteroidales bacterium]
MTKLSKKISLYLPILFSVILIIGIYLGMELSPSSSGTQNIFTINQNNYNKISDILNYVSQDYVDSVDRNKLIEEAIDGILNELDPHSSYISAEEFNAINDPLIGNFEGIGIQFRIIKDTINVIQPIVGGPSIKVGLLAGDRIIKIEDTIVAGVGVNNNDAIKKLKGPKGTKVNIDIYRRGVNELLNFTITRDVIPTYSLDYKYMFDDKIGYIKLSKFSATTYDEFSEAMKSLLELGMEKLILDLRGNVGGYLQIAIKLADDFLKEGKLIVYTEGNSRPCNYAYATKTGMFENNEVVVLIDEGSASASEIIAGAIQDNDRGLIIGRRSFGKGLVQEQLNFPDGSALRLTVARYHTPTGRCIQRPYENGFDDYNHEFYYRIANGELENADSIHFNDSLKYTTPKGKIVYGGGGIMPDIYVPFKSDENDEYFISLSGKGLIFQFAFDYTDKNRQVFNKYKTFDNFDKEFQITNDLFNDLVSYAEAKGIQENKKIISQSKQKIQILLKAYIGRNIYDNEGFYPLYHKIDKGFLKAVEVLSDSLYIKTHKLYEN